MELKLTIVHLSLSIISTIKLIKTQGYDSYLFTLPTHSYLHLICSHGSASWKFYYIVNKAGKLSALQIKTLWFIESLTSMGILPENIWFLLLIIVLCVLSKKLTESLAIYVVLIPQNYNLIQCFSNTEVGISTGPGQVKNTRTGQWVFMKVFFLN